MGLPFNFFKYSHISAIFQTSIIKEKLYCNFYTVMIRWSQAPQAPVHVRSSFHREGPRNTAEISWNVRESFQRFKPFMLLFRGCLNKQARGRINGKKSENQEKFLLQSIHGKWWMISNSHLGNTNFSSQSLSVGLSPLSLPLSCHPSSQLMPS